MKKLAAETWNPGYAYPTNGREFNFLFILKPIENWKFACLSESQLNTD